MTRTISALFASILLVSAPALAEDTGKTKKEEVKPDGTKVKTEKKKDWEREKGRLMRHNISSKS